MKKQLIFFIAATLSFFSADATSDKCAEELLESYFPANFVENTLRNYHVPEDKWKLIVAELQEKNQQVVATVEEKASKMNPNPLKDQSRREAAVALFRETLYDLFSQVLKKNGVDDPEQIYAMLDDIQYQKAKRFMECMEELRDGGE